MFDFIPIEYYTPIFFYFILLVVLGVVLHANILPMESQKNYQFISNVSLVVFVLVIFYMGFRPISGAYFSDMGIYAKRFLRYQQGLHLITSKDVTFQFFIKMMAYVSSVEFFFFTCTVLYIVPLFRATKKMFAEYWGYGFLILVASMSFWSYGTNGIRNGIATSLFILALIHMNKRVLFVALLVLVCAIHKSMLLPVLALVITFLHNNPRSYLIFWFLAIPLSLAFGGFWEGLFGSLEFDDRFSYFTDDTYADQFSSVGFRWDFVLYSGIGVFAGWYYIYKKKFDDVFYNRFLNVYLLSNAFWILVIRSSFSNRFAYLSWFLLGLVIIYPLLKRKLFTHQHRVIGNVMLLYFLFSLALNVILK